MCDKAQHCFYWTSCSAETTITVVHVRLETKNTGPYLWFLFLHLQHSWTSVTPSWLRHTPACLNLRRPSRSLCALIWDKILLPDELGAVLVTLVTADRASVNSQRAPVDAASCRVHTQAVQQLGHHLKAGSWSICKFHFFRFHDKLVHLLPETITMMKRHHNHGNVPLRIVLVSTWNSNVLGAPHMHVGISWSEGTCWDETHKGDPPRL